MRDIIEADLKEVSGHQQVEGVKDLKNAINTVINRSKGIMNFVNAYREFTNIPLPHVTELHISLVFEELKSLFENESINFIIDSDFKILADGDQIGQVLINLLKNAIEATENIEKPKVTIRAYNNQKDKIIEVVDNGSGIKPDELEKIFVPFFTTKPNGTGIGLSLSRQIIQMHGGRLEYDTQTSSGSRFYIVFG
jgi:signal transduction histidine kinase